MVTFLVIYIYITYNFERELQAVVFGLLLNYQICWFGFGRLSESSER
jgi:hypothetical protein